MDGSLEACAACDWLDEGGACWCTGSKPACCSGCSEDDQPLIWLGLSPEPAVPTHQLALGKDVAFHGLQEVLFLCAGR